MWQWKAQNFWRMYSSEIHKACTHIVFLHMSSYAIVLNVNARAIASLLKHICIVWSCSRSYCLIHYFNWRVCFVLVRFWFWAIHSCIVFVSCLEAVGKNLVCVVMCWFMLHIGVGYELQLAFCSIRVIVFLNL